MCSAIVRIVVTAFLLAAPAAQAQDYPSRAITIIEARGNQHNLFRV
jgi:tripartite-type tricarboxylate transporter receptor subunit TctC